MTIMSLESAPFLLVNFLPSVVDGLCLQLATIRGETQTAKRSHKLSNNIGGGGVHTEDGQTWTDQHGAM
jgi:hypothetical protein